MVYAKLEQRENDSDESGKDKGNKNDVKSSAQRQIGKCYASTAFRSSRENDIERYSGLERRKENVGFI